MADLLDIAPSTAVGVVHITGNIPVDVRALHGNDIASIAARFPNLIAALAVAGDNVVGLIGAAGSAIGAIIAAGCDHLGDEQAERIAGALLIEDQIKLVAAILGLTFPNGVAAFIEGIGSLMNGAASEEEKPVRVRLKKSPSELQPSSGEAFPPIMQ